MKHFILGVCMVAMGIVSMATIAAQPAQAATCPNKGATVRILTFPAWYRGLVDTSCNIVQPTGENGLSKFIWTIALNVLEILIQLVAYVASGFMIWGGYTFLRSMGDPGKVKRGKEMLFNAVIGLVISLIAVIAVSLIIGRLTA